MPAPLRNKPKLQRHDQRYMLAFNTLGRSRQYGMSGPQPVTLAEMVAYFQIHGIDDCETQKRYVRVLQDMDEVYLNFMAEKAERMKAQSTAK